MGDHPPSPALQLYIYTFGKFIHAYFLLKLCLYLYINICIHFLIYQHISLFIHTRPLFFFSSLSPFLCRLSGCGHFPVLTMGERALSVLGCSYADDVLHDAPYVITSDMIAALHIDIVAEVPSLTQSYGFPITTSPVSSISDGAISDGGTGAAHFLRKSKGKSVAQIASFLKSSCKGLLFGRLIESEERYKGLVESQEFWIKLAESMQRESLEQAEESEQLASNKRTNAPSQITQSNLTAPSGAYEVPTREGKHRWLSLPSCLLSSSHMILR